MRVFEVQGRRLYRESGKNPHRPGDKGLVDLRQLSEMQRAVTNARDKGRITVEGAREELHTLMQMREALVTGDGRQVGVRFCRVDNELRVRYKANEDARQRRRAERAARKAGRRPKKKKKRR